MPRVLLLDRYLHRDPENKATTYMRDTLKTYGVDPDTLDITYCVMDALGKDPTQKQIKENSERLRREIESLRPDLIVALGPVGLMALFGAGKMATYGKLGIEAARAREDLVYDERETATGADPVPDPVDYPAMARGDLGAQGGEAVHHPTDGPVAALSGLRLAGQETGEPLLHLPIDAGFLGRSGDASGRNGGAGDGCGRGDPPVRGDGIPVLACYHPSAALSRPRFKAGFVRDMEKIAEFLGTKQAIESARTYKTPTSARELQEILFAFDDDIAAGVSDGVISLDTEFDTEADGRKTLVCFSFSWKEAEAWCVVRSDPEIRMAWISFLHKLVERTSRVVAHSMKADWPVLHRWGVTIPWEKCHDTLVQGYVLRYSPLGLKALAENLLGLRVLRMDDVWESGRRVSDIPREQLIQYAAQDADLCLRLYRRFSKELEVA